MLPVLLSAHDLPISGTSRCFCLSLCISQKPSQVWVIIRLLVNKFSAVYCARTPLPQRLCACWSLFLSLGVMPSCAWSQRRSISREKWAASWGDSMTSRVSSLRWAFEAEYCFGLEDWLLWHEGINVAGNRLPGIVLTVVGGLSADGVIDE